MTTASQPPIHVLLVAGEGLPVLTRLRDIAPDVFVICLTTATGEDLSEQQALCDRLVTMRGRDVSEWVAEARGLHRANPIDAAWAFGELGQRECAAIAADLELPWHSAATIQCVYDKALMRQRLQEAGLTSLYTVPVRDAAELAALSRSQRTPLIVKPRSGAGSAGVSLVRSAHEAEQAFGVATGEGRYGGRSVVAEKHVAGEELSVEAFSHRGTHSVVGISQKIVARENKVELGHIVPAATSPQLAARIHDLIPRCLDALGVTFGPTHTEVIASAAGIEIIETHTRCGGGYITDLLYESTGIDLIGLTVRQALGWSMGDQLLFPPAGGPPVHRHAGIFYLTPDRPGTVVGMPASLPATPGGHLIRLDLSALEGLDGTRVPTSNYVRGPYCIVRGDSPEEVVQSGREDSGGSGRRGEGP